jgi:NADH-quinone oxidoreductase subunit N
VDEILFLPILVMAVSALTLPGLNYLLKERKEILSYVALGGIVAAMLLTLDIIFGVFSGPLGLDVWPASRELPQYWMSFDDFSLFFHLIFLFVAAMVVLSSGNYIRRFERHQGEYYLLLIFATIGMMLVASATDLFVLYLALELSSLSTCALICFRKHDRPTIEAAMKFFIIGVLSSAIILFGISLVYGLSGALAPDVPGVDGATTSFRDLGQVFAAASAGGFRPTAVVALVFLIAGFGFKVAVVPFHMWVPDVYEGAPDTITSYLAAASKKMGVVAFFKIFLIAFIAIRGDWLLAMGILAVATMTVGNIAALPQRNIKRMLAYSSIAQAGYILIAVVVGAAEDPDVAAYGLAGGLLQVVAHAFMKGGAFIVVAALAAVGVGQRFEDYRALRHRAPFLAFAMMIFLLSLAGIPPLGGFFSKFVLFSSAIDAGGWFIWLAVAGVLNSSLSLYYYARVIRYMYSYEEEGERRERLKVPRAVTAAVAICLVAIILMGLFAQPFIEFAQQAASQFFS